MQIPRVTEILQPFSGYDKIPHHVLNNAAKRGECVHSICSGLINGAWIPKEMIDESLYGYIKSFEQWKELQIKECIIAEKRYTDERMGFSGQPDLVIIGNDNKKYLVDLKTCSKPQKTHFIQLAAYEYLLKLDSINIDGAMIVYLDRNGQFPDIHLTFDLSKEFNVFVSALECWKYFNKENHDNRD